MSTEILAFVFLWGSGVFLALSTSGRIRSASSISFRSPTLTGESINCENCYLLLVHFHTSAWVPWAWASSLMICWWFHLNWKENEIFQQNLRSRRMKEDKGEPRELCEGFCWDWCRKLTLLIRCSWWSLRPNSSLEPFFQSGNLTLSLL